MDISVFAIICSSSGIVIPSMGDLSEIPLDFFAFQTSELNAMIDGVNNLIDSNSSELNESGNLGKLVTSTELSVYNVVLR